MNSITSLLAVDDDAAFLGDLKKALEADYQVKTAGDVSAAMNSIAQAKPDLILLDMNMPEITGIEFLKVLKQRNASIPVIMLTGETNPDTIVSAMRAGATDYIVKDSCDFLTSLKFRISLALSVQDIKKQNEILSSKVKEADAKYEILGISPQTIRLRSDIMKFKGVDAYVLILGENGTGKELVARAFNSQEEDSRRKFVAVNCAAIPTGLFESELFGHVKGAFTGAIVDKEGYFVKADGGDLFLDEIGDLSLEMQVKLLRVLQERIVTPVGSTKSRHINVRVIAATNKNLESLVREGKFREDLYFRLSRIVLKTSPLREKKEDIGFLADIFAKRFLPGVSISKDAKEALLSHSWRGNIRELENTVERACLFLRGTPRAKILPEHLMLSDLQVDGDSVCLPANLLPVTSEGVTSSRYRHCMEWIERVFLDRGLQLLKGDNELLIERLGISRATYYRKKKALAVLEEHDQLEVM